VGLGLEGWTEAASAGWLSTASWLELYLVVGQVGEVLGHRHWHRHFWSHFLGHFSFPGLSLVAVLRERRFHVLTLRGVHWRHIARLSSGELSAGRGCLLRDRHGVEVVGSHAIRLAFVAGLRDVGGRHF